MGLFSLVRHFQSLVEFDASPLGGWYDYNNDPAADEVLLPPARPDALVATQSDCLCKRAVLRGGAGLC